jgi:dUTP pyrophosphatase
MPSVAVRLTNPNAQMPCRGTLLSAGYDFYSTVDVVAMPQVLTKIPLGLSLAIEEGYFLQLFSRSGLAFKNGLRVIAGTIDSDYRGEVILGLWNDTLVPVNIKTGDRVCQGILLPSYEWNLQRVDLLPDSIRGEGGFGSSGR